MHTRQYHRRDNTRFFQPEIELYIYDPGGAAPAPAVLCVRGVWARKDWGVNYVSLPVRAIRLKFFLRVSSPNSTSLGARIAPPVGSKK